MHWLTWFIHRATGAVLLIGLILHFRVMHFAGAGALEHATIMARLHDPYWIAFNAAFLLAAVYHGFLGLWGIAIELISSERWLRATRNTIITSACGVLLLGLFLLASLSGRAGL